MADLKLTFNCPSGDLVAFDDPVCKVYYSCTLASACSDYGVDCSVCNDEAQQGLDPSAVCFTKDQKSTFESACDSALQSAQSDGTFTQCNGL